MNSKILFVLAILGMAIVGIIGQKEATVSYPNNITLASLDAFTDSESDTESEGGSETTPTDPSNYVADSYIVKTSTTKKVLCTTDGVLEVDGTKYYGNYIKGVTYIVVIEVSQCDGRKEGSWCDMRHCGSIITSIIDLEK